MVILRYKIHRTFPGLIGLSDDRRLGDSVGLLRNSPEPCSDSRGGIYDVSFLLEAER